MNWLYIDCAKLDSEEFLGCEPVDRATWLCLLRFSVGQENGGVIADCAEWSDRKWQQLAGVTKEEAHRASPLWSWEGTALRVWGYPVEQEEMCRVSRVQGKIGGLKSAALRRQKALRGKRGVSHPSTDGQGPVEGPLEGGVEGPLEEPVQGCLNPPPNPCRKQGKGREGTNGLYNPSLPSPRKGAINDERLSATPLNDNRSSSNRAKELELMGCLFELLGDDEMERAGGHWRADWVRKHPDLVEKALADMNVQIREGKCFDNRAAYLEDLLKRWRQ